VLDRGYRTVAEPNDSYGAAWNAPTSHRLHRRIAGAGLNLVEVKVGDVVSISDAAEYEQGVGAFLG